MKKRIISFLLAFVMLVGMLPVQAFAADSYTITTGHNQKNGVENSHVISTCEISGAMVIESTVSEDCLTWDVYLPADTSTSAELTYKLCVVNNLNSGYSQACHVGFNGGDYVKPSKESKKYYVTCSGVPDWNNGEATVTFTQAYYYAGKKTYKNPRTYTLNLHISSGNSNAAPELTGGSTDARTMRVGETYELDVTKIFLDKDSANITYAVKVNDAEPVVLDNPANYSFTPNSADTYTLVFTADDSELTSKPYTVTLTVNNNVAPALAGEAAATASVIQNQTWTLDLTTVFTDAEGDALTYTVAIDDAEPVAVDANYSYTPAEIRDYKLVFRATDIKGDVSPDYFVTLSSTENPGPVLAGGSELTAEGMHGIPWNLDLTTVFVDNEGDPINFTVSVNGGEAVAADSNYSYTPGAVGTHTLVFYAADSKGAAAPAYTVTLTAVENPAPELADGDSAEAAAIQYSPWTMDLSALFTDNDGDVLTYTVAIGDAEPVAAANPYSYTPTALGQQTLVFRSVDNVGNTSPAYTVTLKVSEPDMSSGAWIRYASSNGSLNYVTFAEGEGKPIEGLLTSVEGQTIRVYLPKDYAIDGTVKAAFCLTQTGEVPLLTTSTATTGVNADRWNGKSKVFTQKTFTLSGGQADFSFYYCNKNPSSESPVTWKLHFEIQNDVPTLADGVNPTAETAITAGETYTLDLASVFADVENDPMTYQVSINGEAAKASDANYTFTTNVAGVYKLVFTANDGKGTSTDTYTVTLQVKNSSNTYSMTVDVPEDLEPEFYAFGGYDAEGKDVVGDAIDFYEVETADGMTKYMLDYPTNAETLCIRAEGWGGMAFASGENTNVALRKVQLDVVDYDNNLAESTNKATYGEHTAVAGENGWLLAAGTEYTFTATPQNADLKTTSQKVTLETGAEIYTVQIMLDISNPVAITVPTGAKAQLYHYKQYYSNTQYDAKIIRDNGDGTTTYYFVADTKKNGMIYRVSMEGKITKTGWVASNQKAITVTYSDLDKAPSYRLDNYSGTGQENSNVAEDSVLLNINSRNHLSLPVGQSRVLKAYRAWEIIKTQTDNFILTPDFHYTILSGSDVVSLSEVASLSAADGDWMKLTALKEGVAIIEVTYDALEVSGGSYDGTYGASDPARTGFVVVQVGGSNDTSVNFGIQGFSSIGKSGSKNISYNPDNQKAWDAEFDTLYFAESSGQIDLKPTASTDIQEVAVSNDKGVNWTILSGTDGTYTATIVPGNNIIRVTTGAGVAYQVVRGDRITVTVAEVADKSDGDGEIEVGETIRVTLKGLHTPIPKMAGNYNPGYGGNTDGYSSHHLNYSLNGEPVYGKGTQYTFITETNYIDVVVPESGIVELTDGYIGVGVVGLTMFADGGDSHRNIPDAGCATRGSQTTYHTRSVLPEITITAVDADASIPVTEVKLDKTTADMEVGESLTLAATILPEDATVQTVVWSTSDETIATVNGGAVTAVAEGEVTITAAAGECTATCVITITKPAPIPVTGVSLNVSEAKVETGKTLTLAAVVTPSNATDKTITWTSSNESVAAVNNGIVAAISAGETVITASIGGVQATCKVTVEKVEDTDKIATVYFSYSHDAEFVKPQNGSVAALQKLDIPYFDLALYGLEQYKMAGNDSPTMLHLYIYATEVLYYGLDAAEAGKGYLYNNDLIGSDVFSVSGEIGSLCMDKFWGYDMNLNYYHNYAFPRYSNGEGATADQIVLTDGDVVTVGHFTSWEFFGDPSSIFNYLVANGKTVTLSVLQESELTLNVYRAGADMGLGDGSNSPVKRELDVYYAKADALTSGKVSDWTKLGTTDANGQLKIDKLDLEAGRYVLAVAGQKGVQATTTIVSTPGGVVLEVLESAAANAVQTVIDKIDAIGKVNLDSETAIQNARDAYEALSAEWKNAVSNYDTLLAAETELVQLKKDKEDKEKADAFAAKVDAIDAVEATDDCKSKIDIAKATYELLSADQKELAKDAKVKLDQIEKDYAKLVADEKDKLAADAVEAKIAAISEISLSSEALIQAARAAYNELTDVQKLLVENYVILQAAEKKLAEQKDEAAADAVEAKITAIDTVTLDSEASIKAAREAYTALTDAQKALVANITVLEAAEEALELLKLAGTDLTKMYQKTGSYLAGLSAPGVGSTNGEWRVIGLARAGKTVADSYYNAAVKFVKENMDENGRLHESKSTENSRLIVALTAIGEDVSDVGGYNLLTGLNDMTYIGKQGFNGMIWALIALDTHDYEIPAGDVTREKLVQTILSKQCSDGGWSLSGIAGDPDITGMTLQALAPYYSSNSGVEAAVDKALGWLSGIQAKDGTFSCSEGVTSESLAQVITGLTALGINPETDSRFVKNGVSAMDALSRFYLGDGTFEHGLGNGRNMMATEQAYYALVSYFRLLQGKTSLYDMSDVTIVVPVYKIVDGANSDWQRDDDALTVRADGAFSKFTGVKVDGVTVDKKHYSAKEGSTIITFTEEYLKTLSEGDHTITVSFTDGEASTTVTVLPSDEEAAKRVMDLIAAIGTVTENSGDKIKAAQNAYDSLTEEQKKLVTSYKTLTDAESAYDSLVSKISVSFTLLGCSSHGEGTVHTYAGGNLGTWIGTKTYKVEAGATVKDVLEKALKDAGMSHRNPTGNYVESINGIGEFTNGSNSGWMYTLNGYYPNQGVAEQTVKDGDVIVFHYTDDYTKERASQAFADRDEAAADAVEKLIDAIGTVTLSSKDKIEAARKAYDALTYTQKQKVENEKKLTDAETKYTELKKADDEKKADAVEKQIDQLNSYSATYEKDVKAAKEAYDDLTSEQKKLVGNYAKLAAALKELADEEDKEAAEKVEKLIKQIGTVTKNSEAKIKAAREAYNKLTDEQKALVENLAVLEAAEEKLAELKDLEAVEGIYKKTGNYLEALGTPAPGSVGGEWMVIGLIRSGRSFKTADGYYDAVIKFVQENIDENGRLHNAKSTENSRIILALTAMGKDVTNVDGHNLLTGLKDMEYVRKQGINGPIWALIALDSGNYPTPGGDVTRESLIQVILDAQLADGGWALSGAVSDPDMTGMALQALAPYCKTNADVKKAAEEALAALSKMQAADGSYAGIDGTSSESVAQVIVALSALGIDADSDSRFIKNGISALDALCTFFVKDGGFKHIPEGKLDGMATEQSYYALAAYFRMLEGKTNLFDMTDVMDLGGDTVEEEPAETLPAETEPATTEPVETTVEEGRSFPWWLVVVIVVLAGSIVALVIVSKSKKHKYVR